jgi:hypothetical protein
MAAARSRAGARPLPPSRRRLSRRYVPAGSREGWLFERVLFRDQSSLHQTFADLLAHYQNPSRNHYDPLALPTRRLSGTRTSWPDGSRNSTASGSMRMSTRGPTASPSRTIAPSTTASLRSGANSIEFTTGSGSLNGTRGRCEAARPGGCPDTRGVTRSGCAGTAPRGAGTESMPAPASTEVDRSEAGCSGGVIDRAAADEFAGISGPDGCPGRPVVAAGRD